MEATIGKGISRSRRMPTVYEGAGSTQELGSAAFPVEKSLYILERSTSTVERKEALSSIGRKRNRDLLPILIKYLGDENPELVMQAVRGLLVFRNDSKVRIQLERLREHPNDMVREIVERETNGQKRLVDSNHRESPDLLKNLVVEGDVTQTLMHVPDESIHLTFTSPPYYNARDYSIYQTYEEYIDFLEGVFSQVHRVTKEGRFFILNTSPVIIPRAGRKYSSRRYPVPFDIHARLTSMGWEFIDDIVWAKPEKSAKNRVAGFEVNRKPLTYKANPRTEYVMVYRKKTDKLIDWNLRQYDWDTVSLSKVLGDYERSNVWNIAPTTDQVHSAVFPLKLCLEIVRLYSFVGDLVFDPFAGSGTLARAAVGLERYALMTEILPEYISRMKQQLTSSLTDERPFQFLEQPEFAKAANQWL